MSHFWTIKNTYTGNLEAKILLLNSNPGFYTGTVLGDDYFQKTSRANLRHTKQEYPFYLFDPKNRASFGYLWWSRKLKPLIALYGLHKIAHEIFNVEYFPYYSANFSGNIIVPSQSYSFYLVEEAMKRNALIIEMRSKKSLAREGSWTDELPQLLCIKKSSISRDQPKELSRWISRNSENSQQNNFFCLILSRN